MDFTIQRSELPVTAGTSGEKDSEFFQSLPAEKQNEIPIAQQADREEEPTAFPEEPEIKENLP